MINFIKFLFGARAIDPAVEQATNTAMGEIMLENMSRIYPELKEMDISQKTNYLPNQWLGEKTIENYSFKELLKIQSRINKELQKLLKCPKP